MPFCTKCGYPIPDGDNFCTECGAPREYPVLQAPAPAAGVPAWEPHTIAELARWYNECGLPPYRSFRAFIGTDDHLANSLGICARGMGFLVYLNNIDGTRTEYYNGPDERRAVLEFFRRFKPGVQRFIERRGR